MEEVQGESKGVHLFTCSNVTFTSIAIPHMHVYIHSYMNKLDIYPIYLSTCMFISDCLVLFFNQRQIPAWCFSLTLIVEKTTISFWCEKNYKMSLISLYVSECSDRAMSLFLKGERREDQVLNCTFEPSQSNLFKCKAWVEIEKLFHAR